MTKSRPQNSGIAKAAVRIIAKEIVKTIENKMVQTTGMKLERIMNRQADQSTAGPNAPAPYLYFRAFAAILKTPSFPGLGPSRDERETRLPWAIAKVFVATRFRCSTRCLSGSGQK